MKELWRGILIMVVCGIWGSFPSCSTPPLVEPKTEHGTPTERGSLSEPVLSESMPEVARESAVEPVSGYDAGFVEQVDSSENTQETVAQERDVVVETTPSESPVEAVPESSTPKIPLVTSCTIPGDPPAGSYQVKRDIVYATMDQQPQKLDVAWPNKPGAHPLVIMIHGGSWTAGDKKAYQDTILWLAGQGYAAATINYRLAKAPKNIFPAAVQDIRCAVRWLRANASTYQIDPQRVGVVGFSAGAHLAAMLGTADNVKGLDSPECPVSAPSVQVSGTVAYSGIYELLLSSVAAGKPDPRVVNFLGTAPEKDQAKARLASPLHHLDAQDPPILVHHGSADKTVPVEAARLFKIALESVGVRHAYIEVKGGGHSGVFSRSSQYRTATCTTLAFLKDILKP